MQQFEYKRPQQRLSFMAAKQICLSLLLQLGLFLFTIGTANCQGIPVNGTYYGSFFESDGSWHRSSGVVTISTTSRGSYSGRLQRGLVFYRFSGQFDSDGHASRQIFSFFGRDLTIDLQIDPDDSDIITGSVSDGDWTADLAAYRAVFDRNNVSPDAGRYTMVLPGDFTSTDTPGGNTVATVRVDSAGRLTVSGLLADGWPFFQTTRVSKDGQWPFYFPAYWGDGSVHGWLQLNGGDSAISGDVNWIKPQMRRDWFYPQGFAITVSATGSQYVPPAFGEKIIDIDTGTIEFNGGNLQDGFSNDVTLDSNNRLHNLSSNALSVRFSLSNGSFRGFVVDPSSHDWIPFQGVVLQDRAIATGVFPGWDQTGEVTLQGN